MYSLVLVQQYTFGTKTIQDKLFALHSTNKVRGLADKHDLNLPQGLPGHFHTIIRSIQYKTIQ